MTNTFINENYLTGIVKIDIPDHFPIFFITETDINKTHKSNFVFKREINDVNLKIFNEALLGVNWASVLRNTDPNTAYDEFFKDISFTL